MSSMELSLAGGWPPVWVLGATALSALLVAGSYRRVARTAGRKTSAALVALRASALVLLVSLAVEPILRYTSIDRENTRVLVLVDASTSMTIEDSAGGAARTRAAAKVLAGSLGNIHARLAERFTVEDFVVHRSAEARDFSGTEDQVARAIAPSMPATDLGRAVRAALSRRGREGLAAVVLITDGAENRPGALAVEARQAGVPFYTVGIGGDAGASPTFRDLAVWEVQANAVSYVGIREQARVTLRRSKALADAGQPARAKVRLLSGGELSATVHATFEPGERETRVTLSFVPQKAGRRDFEVVVEALPDEKVTQNNRELFSQAVRESRLAVLYLEGRLGFEFSRLQKYLKREDKDVAYTVIVRKGSSARFDVQSVVEGGADSIRFTREQLMAYDVVILGDLEPEQLGPERLQLLDAFVSTEGRGLWIMGAGAAIGRGAYDGTPLGALLPVTLDAAGEEAGEFPLRLSEEGRPHPLFAGYAERFDPAGPSAGTLVLDGASPVARVKPGAVVLAENPMVSGPGGNMPVVVWQRYGTGKVLTVLADSTCRWYLPFKAMGADSPYARFWGQGLRWLAGRDAETEKDARIILDREEYAPGDVAALTLLCPAETPVSDGELRGEITAPDGSRRPLTFRAPRSGAGARKSAGRRLRARARLLDRGTHRIHVLVPGAGGESRDVSRAVVVGGQLLEFRRPGLDEALLAEVARRTGGAAFNITTARDLPAQLSRGVLRRVGRREITPLNSPWFLCLFVGLVTAEWILRKRRLLP